VVRFDRESPALLRMEESKRAFEFVVDAPETIEPSYRDREHGNFAKSEQLTQGTEGKVTHLPLNRLPLHDCCCHLLLVHFRMRRVVPISNPAFHNKNPVEPAAQAAAQLVVGLVWWPLCPSNSLYSQMPWVR